MASTYRSDLKARSRRALNFTLQNYTFTTIDELRVEERKERKERYSKEKHFIVIVILFVLLKS